MEVCQMKSLCAVFVFCLPVTGVLAEESVKRPGIGDLAPPLAIRSFLQAPADAKEDWKWMRGKVIVLEFWATWCGPCVEAISHMNELADTFKDHPVNFIAITDEEEATIKEFLSKKPIHGWVGLDSEQAMFRAYAAKYIPQTVVVDPEGKIAAVTRPNMLEAEHLRNVLAGRDSGLPMLDDGDSRSTVPAHKASSEDNEQQPAIFQVTIRPSSEEFSGGRSGRAGENEWGFIYESKRLGATVPDLLTTAYGVTTPRLFVESPMPEGRFDLFIRMPHKQSEMAALERHAIEATFGLVSRRESRDLESYALTVKTPGAQGLQPTVAPKARSMSAGRGKFQAINTTIDSWIRGSLEHLVRKPVINDTELTGGYDIELKWEHDGLKQPEPTRVIDAIREQLGLELKLTTRPVDVIVVTRPSNP
jgi:uncharacterized protein (TIGR03435 family)